MARDASPISLVGVVTLRLSHVVSTKGLKGQKGTLSPGVSGYAPRLFISLRFHVLRTTTPIRFGTLSPGVSGYALNPRLFMRFLLLRMSPSILGLTMSNRRIKLKTNSFAHRVAIDCNKSCIFAD